MRVKETRRRKFVFDGFWSGSHVCKETEKEIVLKLKVGVIFNLVDFEAAPALREIINFKNMMFFSWFIFVYYIPGRCARIVSFCKLCNFAYCVLRT